MLKSHAMQVDHHPHLINFKCYILTNHECQMCLKLDLLGQWHDWLVAICVGRLAQQVNMYLERDQSL
jgi:hypothetical protein